MSDTETQPLVDIATITYADGRVYDYCYSKDLEAISVRWQTPEQDDYIEMQRVLHSEVWLVNMNPLVLKQHPGLVIAKFMLDQYKRSLERG